VHALQGGTGGLATFMHGCDKNKAADDCNEKSSGAESLMGRGAPKPLLSDDISAYVDSAITSLADVQPSSFSSE